MGLHIMKYRAGVVDAALEVRSAAEGAGTAVICIFEQRFMSKKSAAQKQKTHFDRG